MLWTICVRPVGGLDVPIVRVGEAPTGEAVPATPGSASCAEGPRSRHAHLLQLLLGEWRFQRLRGVLRV